MRIPQTRIQKIKAGLHIAQAVLVLIAGILSLAVLTENGGISTEIGVFFGLCFLTAPAIIYQIMVPMWTRAWRFANIYAYVIIDTVFAALWFAAFVAVAAWESHGISKGKSDDKSGDGDKSKSAGGCSSFAYGSATKCETSRAAAGFGFFIFALFCATAGLSFRALFEYRRTGVMTGRPATMNQQGNSSDPDKDPWSVNVDDLNHNHDDSNDHPVPLRAGYGFESGSAYGQVSQHDEDDRSGLLNSSTSYHQVFQEPGSLGRDAQGGNQPKLSSAHSFDTLNSRVSASYSSHYFSQGDANFESDDIAGHRASVSTEHRPSSTHRASFPPANYDRLSGFH